MTLFGALFLTCACLCCNLDTNPLSVVSVPTIFTKSYQVYNLFFLFYLRDLWVNKCYFTKHASIFFYSWDVFNDAKNTFLFKA